MVRTGDLVEADPKLAEGWLLLSRLELADGDRRSAAEHYQKALQLRPALKDNALEELVGLPARTTPATTTRDAAKERWAEAADYEEHPFSPEQFTNRSSAPPPSFPTL